MCLLNSDWCCKWLSKKDGINVYAHRQGLFSIRLCRKWGITKLKIWWVQNRIWWMFCFTFPYGERVFRHDFLRRVLWKQYPLGQEETDRFQTHFLAMRQCSDHVTWDSLFVEWSLCTACPRLPARDSVELVLRNETAHRNARGGADGDRQSTATWGLV